VPIETGRQKPPYPRRHGKLRRKGSEKGAIAIMTAFVLIIMIAMFGMALDLSRAYNRKAELQTAADAAALVAAAALDGTPEGIDRAVTEAGEVMEGFTYSYNHASVSWLPGAISFATSPDAGPGGWVDAGTAKLNISKTFFVRIDTSVLDARHGKVQNYLMPVLSSALAETNVSATAVAGRDSLSVLPLAICANSNTDAAALPSGELVEYGFRRGVSYNLMNLNPGGRPPENFLVNPVAPPGTVGTTMKNRLDVVGPFICTGSMALPILWGGEITVERDFPIDPLYVQLNSRFATTASCASSTAPPDPVVKSFDLLNTPWMKDKPDGLSANPLTGLTEPLLTVAEKPAGATKTAYGPLWSYAKPVKYSTYLANKVEPAGGYTDTYGTTDWATLYDPGKPAAQSYPGPTPYQSAGGAPTYRPYRNTRVLRIPLLRCPVPSGAITTASVVGVAKFFMTVPASSTDLYAEFAGMGAASTLGGNVRLYR
jgi:hypothetical protein